MTVTACTLVEDHYHYGLAALANSLISSGYFGTLYCGIKGVLPPWALNSSSFNESTKTLEVTPNFRIEFISINSSLHLAYYKPSFMLQVSKITNCRKDDAIFYVDPDVIFKCQFKSLESWMLSGVSIFEDVNPVMPPFHPKRIQWHEFMKSINVEKFKNLDRYYNSGFVSVNGSSLDFLNTWQMICHSIATNNIPLGVKSGLPEDLFYSIDQDAMNIALMSWNNEIFTIGGDGMDFTLGGYYLSHAIGRPKPWEGGFVKNSVSGRPPNQAVKNYLIHANGKILPFPVIYLFFLKSSALIASFIGRFYRRS